MTFWSSPQREPNLSFQQHSIVQGTQTALKIGSRNRHEINKNPSQDPKVSFLVLPGVPGSSQGPPGCQSGDSRFAKRQICLFDRDILLFDGKMFLFDGNTRAGAWPKSLRDPSSHIQSHTKLSLGHQNTSILDPRFNRIPTSAKKLFLQHFSHQMLVSGAPDVQIQTLKSFKKVTWEPAGTKNMYFDSRSPKSY